MPHLPHTIAFRDQNFPEFAHIFRDIDIAIAALVASDPAFRRKVHQRRSRKGVRRGATVTRPRAARQAA